MVLSWLYAAYAADAAACVLIGVCDCHTVRGDSSSGF